MAFEIEGKTSMYFPQWV